jgi:hypothetical protein
VVLPCGGGVLGVVEGGVAAGAVVLARGDGCAEACGHFGEPAVVPAGEVWGGGGGFEELVLERAETAADHGGDFRDGVEAGDEGLALTALRATGVEVDAVVEVVVSGSPETPLAEIEVPWEERPETGAAGVAVDVVVFGVEVDVAGDGVGGHEVDHFGEVDVVEEEGLAGVGVGQVHADDEGVEVGVAFELTVFLFDAGDGISGGIAHPVVHFVESAVLVEAGAFEVDVVGVFDEGVEPVEGTVETVVGEEAVVGGDAGFAFHFVGEVVADAGFVGVDGEEIDVLGAGLGGIRAPFEAIAAIAVDIVGFFEEGSAGGALAVEVDADVVVEFAVEEDGAAGAAGGGGGGWALDEAVDDGQLGVDGRVDGDRAEVLRGVDGV